MSMFQKATKKAVRARIALDGPSGSGKTWTGLTWATVFGKKIAAVDTERGSMSLYADKFDFNVIEMSPPFHPDRLIETIRSAEEGGYDVILIDSLSHFWDGEGGTLDIVDAAAQRAKGNSWAGWKSGTPVLRHLVDTMLGSDLHVIATMRSRTEWVLEEKERNGRTVTDPKRVGLAPVMRAGMEYEFTLVAELDLEHRMTISKSRADVLADQVIQPGRAAEAAEIFVAWANSGEELASKADVEAIKQALNRIEPREDRLAAKKAFADQFGNPDFLVASRVADAHGFVAGLAGETSEDAIQQGGVDSSDGTATPAPAEGGEPAQAGSHEPGGVGESEQESPVSTGAGPSSAGPDTTPSARRRSTAPGVQLHRQLGAMKFNTDQQAEIIYSVSQGRTTHAAELDEGETAAAYRMGDDIVKGRESIERVIEFNDQHRAAQPEPVAS